MPSTRNNLRTLEDYAFANVDPSEVGNEPHRPGSLQVLVVEDDAADVYLIKTALANNPRVGNVLFVKDGVEALELIDSRTVAVDLAIIDLHMPRKDGFALLRELGARVTVDFPSVVLTSSRSGADAVRSRKRGAEMFLVKPNTIGKLSSLMDEVISAI